MRLAVMAHTAATLVSRRGGGGQRRDATRLRGLLSNKQTPTGPPRGRGSPPAALGCRPPATTQTRGLQTGPGARRGTPPAPPAPPPPCPGPARPAATHRKRPPAPRAAATASASGPAAPAASRSCLRRASLAAGGLPSLWHRRGRGDRAGEGWRGRRGACAIARGRWLLG